MGTGTRRFFVGMLLSRAVIAAALYGAPLLGLPAVALPEFAGRAFLAASVAAEWLGWGVFVLIGAVWTAVYAALAARMSRWTAAAATAALNWVACTMVALPTAAIWAPRVAAGAVSAPGWLGLAWSPSVPWTLLLAFGLSAPAFVLTDGSGLPSAQRRPLH